MDVSERVYAFDRFFTRALVVDFKFFYIIIFYFTLYFNNYSYKYLLRLLIK
jgi:hypothetical protein